MSIRRSLVLPVLLAPALLRAQAISHPNQIVGSIELRATNPEILAELATRPAPANAYWQVSADSVATVPMLSHFAGWQVAARADVARYELTVEAATPGIAYDLRLRTYCSSDASLDYYNFAMRRADPVAEEPAPDVVADFSECAGAIRVAWTDAGGAPLAVSSGVLRAYRETSPGSGRFELQQQAADSVPAGATSGLIVVRGDGALYKLQVDYNRGSDPFSDTLIFRWETTLRVGCDEVVAADVPYTGGACTNGDPIVLGRITGAFDVVGEEEHQITGNPSSWWWGRTLMDAGSGPWGNSRYDLLARTPASGDFELENLMPSVVVSPPVPYRVRGQAYIRTGNRFEQIESPALLVPVDNGADVSLGDAFVMDPILVFGDVFLAGPPRLLAPYGSILDDLKRVADNDLDGDGLADGLARGLNLDGFSQVTAYGREDAICHGGLASASFMGGLDAAGDTFVGDHELVLGNPLGATHSWEPKVISLRFTDSATPEDPFTYVASTVTVQQQDSPRVALAPGDRLRVDHRYCMSRLNLSYLATAGTFVWPMMSGDSGGVMVGRDFEGHDANYTVRVAASGTPTLAQAPSSTGLVVTLLPQGDYTLTPTVQSINPGGGRSTTELLPVDVSVGCREVISLFPDFILDLDHVAPCSDAGFLTLNGRVRGGADVASVACTVNGGSPLTACSPCGVDPAFVLDVPLGTADSTIVVTAMAADGREASRTGYTLHAQEPSALDLRPATEPLRVRKDASGGLTLAWEDVPGATAAAYRGTLSSLWHGRAYDHAGFGACGVAGGATSVPMPPEGVYFVVGGECDWGNGSLGRDSMGRELPPARNRCP